ncbi:MAG: DinB family protein [Candidatus Rokuibacteriota bacterium]
MLTQDEVAKMSLEERLGRLAAGPEKMVAAIAGQNEAVLARRPDARSWAPKEVVCHLRDTEESFMQRFQAILVMDEPKFLPVEPDRWAEERQYLRNNAGEALGAFRKRREETLALLRGLTAQQWPRGGVHAVRGRMTMDDWLSLMVWHDENHLDQLRRGLRGEP